MSCHDNINPVNLLVDAHLENLSTQGFLDPINSQSQPH